MEIGLDLLHEKDANGHSWSWPNVLCQVQTVQNTSSKTSVKRWRQKDATKRRHGNLDKLKETEASGRMF